MKKELLFNAQTESENLESELKRQGFHIEKMSLSETGPIQCDACMKEGRFDFHDEAWSIEGDAFCKEHKENALKKLEEIDKNYQKEKAEREKEPSKTYLRPDNLFKAVGLGGDVSEDEDIMLGLITEVYRKAGKNYLKEMRRVREENPGMPRWEVIKKLYEEIEEEQGKKE